MLIEYNNLDILSANKSKGTSVGVNIDEEDDFDLVKRLPQRSKAAKQAPGKAFGGKKSGADTTRIERNITIANGHR